MQLSPPRGSRIAVLQDGSDDVIIIPQPDVSVARYFIGLLMLFWLGGWSFGFVSAYSKVRSGQGDSFLLLWLCGWTVGGAFAAYYLYRILRPSVPESFRLRGRDLVYDSGIPPFQLQAHHARQADAWRALFPKRLVVELDRERMQSLRLRETDAGNRLTVYVGSTRLDLGRAASEVEREWLSQVLKERYRRL